MPFVHYLEETSAMKYWRYIINNVEINLHDNDSKVNTFNPKHSSQFWLANYSTKSETNFKSSLQCIPAALLLSGSDRFIWVVLWRSI